MPTRRLFIRAAVPGGVGFAANGLIAGLALLAVTLVVPSLPGLIAASVVIGASAGICTGAGLASLAIAVPAPQRARVTAFYYIALYGSITVPVIGDGLVAQETGIAAAGLVVCAALATAVAAVLFSLARDRAGSRPGSPGDRTRQDRDSAVCAR